MLRAVLASVLSLMILGLIATSVVSQDAAKPQASDQSASKDGAEPRSKDESSSDVPATHALPQECIVGKIAALCASDVLLLKVHPLDPYCAPFPQWLVVNAKNTPQAPSLLLKAAEEGWTIAAWYGRDCVVTTVCVQFYPKGD